MSFVALKYLHISFPEKRKEKFQNNSWASLGKGGSRGRVQGCAPPPPPTTGVYVRLLVSYAIP